MKKRERELKRILENYRIPEADEKARERGRKQLSEAEIPYRMTDMQFILGQIGFIRLRTWIGELLVLGMAFTLMYCCRTKLGYTDYRMFSLLSTMTPLFLVLHIEEFARICYKSMLEIEMATRYSLTKLVLSRLSILGVVDLIVMGSWIASLNMLLDESLIEILLYSLVPFNLTVIGMLYLLKYSEKGRYGYQAFAYTAFVCTCFIAVPHYRPAVYSSRYLNIWMLVCIISLFVLVKILKEVWKDVQCAGGILTAEG